VKKQKERKKTEGGKDSRNTSPLSCYSAKARFFLLFSYVSSVCPYSVALSEYLQYWFVQDVTLIPTSSSLPDISAALMGVGVEADRPLLSFACSQRVRRKRCRELWSRSARKGHGKGVQTNLEIQKEQRTHRFHFLVQIYRPHGVLINLNFNDVILLVLRPHL